jgi:predicted transcriptional regulator
VDEALRRLAQNTDERSKLTLERDELIRAARAEKVSVVRIAEAAGLTRQQVHNILKGETK